MTPIAVRVATLESARRAGVRRVTPTTSMLPAPARAAGAGPSRAMITTRTMIPEEMRAVRVLSRSDSAATDRASSAASVDVGCH